MPEDYGVEEEEDQDDEDGEDGVMVAEKLFGDGNQEDESGSSSDLDSSNDHYSSMSEGGEKEAARAESIG